MFHMESNKKCAELCTLWFKNGVHFTFELDGDGNDAIEMCLFFDEDGKKNRGSNQSSGGIVLLIKNEELTSTTKCILKRETVKMC